LHKTIGEEDEELFKELWKIKVLALHTFFFWHGKCC